MLLPDQPGAQGRSLAWPEARQLGQLEGFPATYSEGTEGMDPDIIS